MTRVTEGSVYQMLARNGSCCVNADCGARGETNFRYELIDSDGGLPSEQVRCSQCGTRWVVKLSYGQLLGVSDANGDSANLPKSTNRRGPRDLTLGGARLFLLLKSMRRLISEICSPSALPHNKAEAIAHVKALIPEDLGPD